MCSEHSSSRPAYAYAYAYSGPQKKKGGPYVREQIINFLGLKVIEFKDLKKLDIGRGICLSNNMKNNGPKGMHKMFAQKWESDRKSRHLIKKITLENEIDYYVGLNMYWFVMKNVISIIKNSIGIWKLKLPLFRETNLHSQR
jgi:hypothetical protein